MDDLRRLLADAAQGPADGFDADAVRGRVRQRARRRRAASGFAVVALLGVTAVGVATTADGTGGRRDDQVVAGDPDPTTSVPTTTPAPTTSTSTVPGPPSTPTGTPVVPPPTTTVAPPSTVPAELEDGRHFGYLVGAEEAGGATVLVFDLAQWFEGDEADRAAQEDGAVGPGEEVENDVYVRNQDDQVRRVQTSPSVAVTVVDCDAGCASRPAELDELLARPQPTPVWLEVERGLVVVADEQYRP